MPSDETLRSTFAALAPLAGPWRASLVQTLEELRTVLRGPAAPATVATSLGAFGAGRIDVERFGGIVTRTRPLEDAVLLRLRIAFDTLRSLAEREPADLLVLKLPAGQRLRDGLDAAFAEIGRGFGAAREASLARQGTFCEETHGELHRTYPFARWNARERHLAPPVVVEVAGEDLHVADLAEFLDGSVRIVLVVRGAAPPAALVRLITPGTFVMQTSDPKALARLATAGAPAIAALLPEGGAEFVHDPSLGRTTWDRVRLVRTPAEPPRKAVGGTSVHQQVEELRQLAALALRPSDAAVTAAASALSADEKAAVQSDPAGRLAAWLLEASAATQGNAAAHG